MPRRRNDDHYDGTNYGGDSRLAVALMHDEHAWELTVNDTTVAIKTKKTRYELTVVTEAPPHLFGYINGPAVNLERWLRTQGELRWTKIS